jgi:NAD dependent epimerase/dehydratase
MNLKGKNVLVTGSEGFIGSHLVEKLVKAGCNVRAFVLYNSFNNWGWLDALDPEIKNEIEIFQGNICHSDNVYEAVKNIDVVFHLGALIAIPYSYLSPESYVATNVMGTTNMLQAARNHGVDKFIHTSTSEVYGTALYAPIDEKHPLQGQSPYSASKIAADQMAKSFHLSFDLPVIIARPFNTYGPRQSARAVIPTIISQLLSGKKELKLGDLTPTRDFNFVLDTANGFIKTAESENALGETINIGSGKEYSIQETVDMILKLTGSDAKIITDNARIRPKKSEVNRLLADNQKAKILLGWEPEFTFEEGLTQTIDWIKQNLHHFKTDIYNV